MKFLADINLPQTAIKALIKLGHDVSDIKLADLKLSDIKIIRLAQKDKRIILTRDKDFILLTQFPKYQVPTIVIRLRDQKPQHIVEHLRDLLNNQKEEILKRSLTIIREESANSYSYE